MSTLRVRHAPPVHPHPRIKCGAGSNLPPSRGKGPEGRLGVRTGTHKGRPYTTHHPFAPPVHPHPRVRWHARPLPSRERGAEGPLTVRQGTHQGRPYTRHDPFAPPVHPHPRVRWHARPLPSRERGARQPTGRRDRSSAFPLGLARPHAPPVHPHPRVRWHARPLPSRERRAEGPLADEGRSSAFPIVRDASASLSMTTIRPTTGRHKALTLTLSLRRGERTPLTIPHPQGCEVPAFAGTTEGGADE